MAEILKMNRDSTTEVSDCFIVDIENMSPNKIEDNHRISGKLQKNFSRKGSLRGERNKTTLSTSSAGITDGTSNAAVAVGGSVRHNSTIATMAGVGTTINFSAENRWSSGKYLKQRTSFIDPRRVLLFFATLSSMGTMVLIYFTLSISKFSGDNSIQAQQ